MVSHFLPLTLYTPTTQGLKRSEQHALIELFKTRVVATSGGDQRQSLSERGLIQPIKKLEKLMRF